MKISTMSSFDPRTVVLLDISKTFLSEKIKVNDLLRVTKNEVLAQIAWRSLDLERGIFNIGLEFLFESVRSDYESYLKMVREQV